MPVARQRQRQRVLFDASMPSTLPKNVLVLDAWYTIRGQVDDTLYSALVHDVPWWLFNSDTGWRYYLATRQQLRRLLTDEQIEQFTIPTSHLGEGWFVSPGLRG